MKYKGKKVTVKWYAFIYEIDEKIVKCQTLEVYPIPSIIKTYIDLPIGIFDKERLAIGVCFYLYAINDEFQIEWIEKKSWNEEE